KAAAGLTPESAPPPAAEVRLGDDVVFTLRAAVGTKSPDERARQASKALSAAVKPGGDTELRISREGEFIALYAGKLSVVRLSPQDALAEHMTLDALADDVAEAVEDALT